MKTIFDAFVVWSKFEEKMKPEIDLQILPVTSEELPIVGKFLREYFFPFEPLNSSLGRCPDLEDIPFLDILKEGLSLKAVNLSDNSKDNLVGIVVNKEASLDKKTNTNVTKDPKSLKIRKILRELDEKSKIWEVVNNENHFNILSVSVNTEFRGLRIGQRLVEESLKLARSLNYKYASIECSSFYSAKIATEMGFELLFEIPYEEYLDSDQEQVFKVNKPHKAIKKFIKRL